MNQEVVRRVESFPNADQPIKLSDTRNIRRSGPENKHWDVLEDYLSDAWKWASADVWMYSCLRDKMPHPSIHLQEDVGNEFMVFPCVKPTHSRAFVYVGMFDKGVTPTHK